MIGGAASRTARIALGLSVALSACAASQLAPFDAGSLDGIHGRVDVEIPPTLEFDREDEPRSAIRVGDCAVYSLRLRNPEGEKSWFVRVAVAAHRPSARGSGRLSLDEIRGIDVAFNGLVRFHVLVMDSDGVPCGESVTDPVSTEVLREGFAGACAFGLERPALADDALREELLALPPEAQRPVVVSTLSTTTVLTLVLKCEPLAPLLAEAVRRPSILSIVGNLDRGIEVTFYARQSRPWPSETRIPTDETFLLPFDVQAFGERALAASMVVGRTRGWMHVGAGILSIAAVHPTDSDIRVAMQMQAVGRLRHEELARVIRAEAEHAVSPEFR